MYCSTPWPHSGLRVHLNKKEIGARPCLQEVADEQGRRAARERFQQIRTAYDVLRDPDRRRAYDRGETVEM